MFGEKCLLLRNGHELCSRNGQNDNVPPFNLMKRNFSLKVQKPLFCFRENKILCQQGSGKNLFVSTIEKYFCQKNYVISHFF